MKILLATSMAIPSGGGIASYNQELVKSLKDGNDLYLLTAADEHNVDGYIRTDSIYGYNIYDYKFAKRLIDKINGDGYELIINSNSYFIAIAAPFLKAPIVSVAHFVNGIAADCAGYNSAYNSAIIALSYYCKTYLEKKFNIGDVDKVKVIYNFVPSSNNNFEKTKTERLKIVYPGGTSIKKSVDVVMDVVYRLKRTSLDFSFYWLGGSLLPSANFSVLRIKDIKQMIHNDPRFIITGIVPRNDAERIISSANVFLLPSRGEGCPMTLLEAMRDGCIPIVSDARHGSRELIELSKAGFVLKQGDSKSIVKLISDIINHHENFFEYYIKTKSFSEETLSLKEWVAAMNNTIFEAIKRPKNMIYLDEACYKQSAKEFKRLLKQDRRKSILYSAINRIKMDWLYLKWRGWK